MAVRIAPLGTGDFAAEVRGADLAADRRRARPPRCGGRHGSTPCWCCAGRADIGGAARPRRDLRRTAGAAAGGLPLVGQPRHLDHRVRADRRPRRRSPDRVRRRWHTDDSYLAVPAKATMLYAQVIPPTGGDTLFADTTAAYEALDTVTARRAGGSPAVHTYQSRRNMNTVPTRTASEEAQTPPVVHPLVRTHPDTGRRSLYLNPNRMEAVVGLDDGASDALLDALIEHATQDRFVYRQCGSPTTWCCGTTAGACTGRPPTTATPGARCSGSSSRDPCLSELLLVLVAGPELDGDSYHQYAQEQRSDAPPQ